MKKLIYILFALPWILVSCSQEADQVVEESVEVNFSTAIPGQIGTRASGLSVNKLICAVFEKDKEVKDLRQTITITDANSILYAPRLLKGRTYKVVFWAMKDANYDVTDLTRIVRSSTGSSDEADYDAFTATTSITVENSVSVRVTLTRPLAQLNLGVSELDWTTVSDVFGQTPKTTTVTYYVADSFDALTGESGSVSESKNTRMDIASGAVLTVNHNSYKSLGSFFILLPKADSQTLVDINVTVCDQADQIVRSNISIPQVPVQRNYKTNLVGGLLTGTVNYQVIISDDFSNEEHVNEL